MTAKARSGRHEKNTHQSDASPKICSFSNNSKIRVYVKNRSYDSLVDTGADVSCISKALAEVLIDQKLVVLQPSSLPLIKGVGGMPVKIAGTVDLPLKLAGLQISQSFVVLENLTCPLILGITFHLIEHMLGRVKPPAPSRSRSRRALLPFVGDIASSLFGVATANDVKTLAKHINKLYTMTLSSSTNTIVNTGKIQ